MDNIMFDEALDFSRHIVISDSNPRGFSIYSKGYFVTTECIKEYLTNEEFNKGRALTVLASGDQVFNLAFKGVRTIDAFDINKLQYYVYHLRKAMIKNLSLKEFLKANSYLYKDFSSRCFPDILEMIKEDLPEDVYEYFRKIIEFCLEEKGKLSNLFYDSCAIITLSSYNNYLSSKRAFHKLRKGLEDTEVSLYFEDATEIPKIVSGTYDIILLSNIADYLSFRIPDFNLERFNEFIVAFYNLLQPDGLIINYLYNVLSRRRGIINGTNITRYDLGVSNVKAIDAYEGYYLVRKQ